MPEQDYKPNSHKYHEISDKAKVHVSTDENKEEQQKRVKVTEKKSLGQRFKELFFNVTFKEALRDTFEKVIVPAIQDGIYNAIMATVSSLLGRDAKRYFDDYRSDRHVSTSKTAYHRSCDSQQVRPKPSNRFRVDSFEFDTIEDARWVLSQMNEQARKYDGFCSISAFYDFVDCERPNDWTHDRWGWSWESLDRARIVHKSNGYTISICEPDTYID